MENKSLLYGRSQLRSTHFIHQQDRIPIYENFCFAMALIRQKTVESVNEGKELFERLYAFQAGNFPLYLHEYPHCYCPLQSLKVATILHQLLRDFSRVLPPPFKQKTRRVLKKLLATARRRHEEKPLPPIWAARYAALNGESTLPVICTSAADVVEEVITAQLQGREIDPLIHPRLLRYCGPSEKDESFSVLEAWANCPGPLHESHLKAIILTQPYSPKLRSGTVGSWELSQTETSALSFVRESEKGGNRLALRFLWGTHRFMIMTQEARVKIEEGVVRFDLPELEEVVDNDLFEIALYCDYETKIRIEGQSATLFHLGQMVAIETPERTIHLRFEIEDGSGDFVGHISRNADGWKIALRTLRRSKQVRLKLQVYFDAAPRCQRPCPSHEVHCPQTAQFL